MLHVLADSNNFLSYPEKNFQSRPEKFFKALEKNFKALEKNFKALEKNFQAVRKKFSSCPEKIFKPSGKNFQRHPKFFFKPPEKNSRRQKIFRFRNDKQRGYANFDIPSFVIVFSGFVFSLSDDKKKRWEVDYLLSMIFQTQALSAAPINGATMKIQRLVSAVPPWKMAGAMLRAGLTDVPV